MEMNPICTFPYSIKNALRANDAQLAERKLLRCSPLAREDCAISAIFLPIFNINAIFDFTFEEYDRKCEEDKYKFLA